MVGVVGVDAGVRDRHPAVGVDAGNASELSGYGRRTPPPPDYNILWFYHSCHGGEGQEVWFRRSHHKPIG